MQRRHFLTGLGIMLGLTATSRAAWAGEAPKEIIEELYQLSAAKKGEWQSMFL